MRPRARVEPVMGQRRRDPVTAAITAVTTVTERHERERAPIRSRAAADRVSSAALDRRRGTTCGDRPAAYRPARARSHTRNSHAFRSILLQTTQPVLLAASRVLLPSSGRRRFYAWNACAVEKKDLANVEDPSGAPRRVREQRA